MIARRSAPASVHRGRSIAAESSAMNVHRRNLVGPEIRKLRRQPGWTQDKLANPQALCRATQRLLHLEDRSARIRPGVGTQPF